ncbi:hypothetical protein GU243_06120 [Pseudarthrobacter psychrotolerans]|uniref:Uncharacterized protein n=1 Tax=Pseudarthrobacter psychrotolerans TaxID=2697569 RepID=A0A6P1NJ60_9MICC|nr:HGGxSTG domain-containing protein [Pseudarthrobacter psychrotolerans]QHK19388.1 hypothetical protein GU243_06120 [Pseudarthrobacter psychrotolerans]
MNAPIKQAGQGQPIKRSTQFYCAAKKTDGSPCRAYAIKGGRVCRVHGGMAPSVRAAAARRAQEEAARRQLANLGEPVAIDPAEALLQLIAWKYGEVKWLRARVQDLPGDELTWGLSQTDVGIGPEGPIDKATHKASPSVWWALLREAEDQLADYAARALRAGVDERRVKIAEQQGLMVHAVMMAVFNRLALTPEQWTLARAAAPEELRRLAG